MTRIFNLRNGLAIDLSYLSHSDLTILASMAKDELSSRASSIELDDAEKADAMLHPIRSLKSLRHRTSISLTDAVKALNQYRVTQGYKVIGAV